MINPRVAIIRLPDFDGAYYLVGNTFHLLCRRHIFLFLVAADCEICAARAREWAIQRILGRHHPVPSLYRAM